MPASPAMRFSPGRESRSGNHKRGRSLENGMVFKERDDDLALFNEVQSRERDNFLLLSNDDFEDTFVTKLRDFSDNKLGINIAARGESSDFLNTEEEKNDYEWLITPPDTPLFTSLDDEAPHVILPQRGRSRAQPISISRSSTMEKSHRSSRGSPSPNRLSTSPQSSITTFQPATRPTTGSRRPSSPSSKASTPPPWASPPPSRRLSTGSTTTRGISPVKTSRGNSASPKIRAWQANIPGFSTEAPPNLRTSLADRPASYVRGSSPASRNSRQSQSPTPRSISSSHSHDRDRFSPRSKGSIASSVDDDVESLPSVMVNDSERSNLRKVGGFRNNKASFSQKPNRTVPSSSAPKRSFDLALRQMDHKRGPQNRFRPLLSSVPSSNLYTGKAWNSSVTTSSNASSDLATSGAHDIEETEPNEDDATSGYVKVPDSTVDHEVIILKKTDSLNMGNGTHDQFGHLKGDLTVHSQLDGVEILAECDTATSVVSDDVRDGSLKDESLKGTSLCSRCGCRYFEIRPTQEEIKLCENCQKSYSSLTSDEYDRVTSIGSFQKKETVSDEEHESFNTLKPEMNPVEVESTEVTKFEQHEDLVKDGESTHGEPIWNVLSESSLSEPRLEEEEPTQVSQQVISQPSYSDAGSDQIQHAFDFSDSKVESLVLKKSNSIKALVFKSGNFSASSISYDDLSYVRDSTNSIRSSIGRGSLSTSSSFDFGPSMQSDTRFNRQLSSKKSEMENYKHHKRSVSSSSGTSGHAFHPSSVGTSTLDSFEVSSVHVGKDLADVASVGAQETPCENNHTCENEEVDNARVEIGSNSELPTFNQTDPDSGEVLLHESSNFEDLEKVDSEEDTSLDLFVERSDVAEVQLSVISVGEFDHTCLSSPASQCNVSQHSEANIEELEDPCDLAEPGKDVAASAMDGDTDTSHHATGIIEESLVLIEGEGKTKGRSLTLEEATDTILFCSSIVQNLAYEAATLSIQKQTPPHPDPSENNTSWPLIPAIVKGRKEVETKKTNKRSSKSQKNRQKKATTKPPNNSNTNTNEETDLAKPHIVYPNNKENRRPPELESKCNCSIM